MFLDLVSKKGEKKVDFLFTSVGQPNESRVARRRTHQIAKAMSSTFSLSRLAKHAPNMVTLNILRIAMKREGVPLTTKDLRVIFDVINPVKESMKQIQQSERLGVSIATAQAGCDRFFMRRRMHVNFKRLVNAIKQAGKEKRAMRGSLEVRGSLVHLFSHTHTHTHTYNLISLYFSPSFPVCRGNAHGVEARLQGRDRSGQGARGSAGADPRVH